MASGDYSRLRLIHFDDALATMADTMFPESMVRDEVLVQLYPFVPSHVPNTHGDTAHSMT